MEERLHITPETGEDGVLLASLLRSSAQVFIKKLANNDRDWSYDRRKHQGGVYVPSEMLSSGFFPDMTRKEGREGKDDIMECSFDIEWPAVGISTNSRLVNYRSKRGESHLTRLPKDAFRSLSPASFIVICKVVTNGVPVFRAVTVDSLSDEALLLADTFGMAPDFSFDLFEPEEVLAAERDLILDFVDELITAWKGGDMAAFAAANVPIPQTHVLAAQARQKFLTDRGILSLDPTTMDNPGDAVLEISRKIELDLFRSHQRRSVAVRLVRIVMGDTRSTPSPSDVIRALVDSIPLVDELMLSAGQQRKVRAGYSFEHHIEAMLLAAEMPFRKQLVLPSNKRPDFVLPSFEQFSAPAPGTLPGLILSAKTTLRERWKQVKVEKGDGDLFLATLDEGIASIAIADMAKHDIVLVVPESLHASRNTEYAKHANVRSFSDFFRNEVAGRRMPGWPVSSA